MHRHIAKVISAAIALAVPVHAVAVGPTGSSTEDSDARCFVAIAMLPSSDDPARQQATRTGSMLFVGKLLGRNPSIDLEAAMRKATAEIGSNLDAELKRCGGEMQAIGASVTSAGMAMQKKP
jgi:enamine deaminase RidA (YjgF/YER057c/UK114 family)